MPNPLIESFTIPITEWKTVDVGKNTIRIKGVALKGDIVSKNNRHYIAKELKKATNTWIGKPVNVNHDNSKKVGTIKWMDYDETAEVLIYEAEINQPPYVDMLRNKSTEIRGVSIQADYLYNQCPKCNMKFFTEEDWQIHMAEVEFMRNMNSQPHGIIGNGLSLVLSPEIPGYGGTSVELAEMQRKESLRLSETIIKEEKEKEEYLKMSKIALKKEESIAVGHAKIKLEPKEELLMQDHMSTIIPHETSVNPKIEEKEEKKPAQTTEKVSTVKECSWLRRKRRAHETLTPLTETEFKQHYGVPMEEYTSKFGPEIATASYRQLQESLQRTNKTVAAVKILQEEATDLENQVDTFLETLTQSTAQKISEVAASIPKPYDDKPLRELIPKPYDDKPIKEAIAAIPKDDDTWKAKIAEIDAKMEQLKEIQTIKDVMAMQKKDFDALLDSADKSVKEYFAANKKELQEKADKIKDLEQKLLKAQETIETDKTRVDNLEDKQEAKFKSKAKETVQKPEASATWKPT